MLQSHVVDKGFVSVHISLAAKWRAEQHDVDLSTKLLPSHGPDRQG